LTDERHGWRVVALYSWLADHLLDKDTGHPSDAWFDAYSHTEVIETEYPEDPLSLIRALISEQEEMIANTEAGGNKLLSITITATKVPVHGIWKELKSPAMSAADVYAAALRSTTPSPTKKKPRQPKQKSDAAPGKGNVVPFRRPDGHS